MSTKAPHASSPVGAAGIERQTVEGRKRERAGLLAQARFYREKRDIMRAHECERAAEALQ